MDNYILLRLALVSSDTGIASLLATLDPSCAMVSDEHDCCRLLSFSFAEYGSLSGDRLMVCLTELRTR
jgi:hypothetical protein